MFCKLLGASPAFPILTSILGSSLFYRILEFENPYCYYASIFDSMATFRGFLERELFEDISWSMCG